MSCLSFASYLQVQLSQKGEDVRRRFEVLYLDERVRVAQFLSDEEQEPVYFVFKRVEEEATEQVHLRGGHLWSVSRSKSQHVGHKLLKLQSLF